MDGIEFEKTIKCKMKAFGKSRKKILELVKINSVHFPVIQDFDLQTNFRIGDYVETIVGDKMSGIKKSGRVIGFGKWSEHNTLKIDTGDKYAKQKVSILEKNAILLKRGSRSHGSSNLNKESKDE